MLAEVISDMNSNYENRKHGGNSQVFSIEEKIISSFPQIGLENVFAEEFYLPVGQRIEPGTLEALKVTINKFKNQKVAKNSSKKLS